MPIGSLNHAVLYVSDLDRALDFYVELLGLTEFAREGPMVFLRSPSSDRHHDLALFGVGPQAVGDAGRRVGLFHLAIEVDTLDDLSETRTRLAEAGVLSGQADHGTSKSVFAADPDGNLLEILWPVPRHLWQEGDEQPATRPLDLERERAYFADLV